jgi:hypothetical protein
LPRQIKDVASGNFGLWFILLSPVLSSLVVGISDSELVDAPICAEIFADRFVNPHKFLGRVSCDSQLVTCDFGTFVNSLESDALKFLTPSPLSRSLPRDSRQRAALWRLRRHPRHSRLLELSTSFAEIISRHVALPCAQDLSQPNPILRESHCRSRA